MFKCVKIRQGAGKCTLLKQPTKITHLCYLNYSGCMVIQMTLISDPFRLWFIFNTSRKMSKYGDFSGLYFPAFRLKTERYEVFSRNAGKYGLENTLYLDIFYTVQYAVDSHSCKPLSLFWRSSFHDWQSRRSRITL